MSHCLRIVLSMCVAGVPSAWADDTTDGSPTEAASAISAEGEGEEAERPKLEVAASFTDDFEIRYWQVPDRVKGLEDSSFLNYVEQVNRLTANVRAGAFSGYAQVDQVALFANTSRVDGQLFAERDLLSSGLWSPFVGGAYDPATHGLTGWDRASRNVYLNLEKLRFGYAKGDVTFEVGDSYTSFGRGIALNVNRNVDIDLDTSIQGAKLLWQPGAWDVVAVFGQLNRQQVFQDNPNAGLNLALGGTNNLIFGDRRHTVGGVSVTRYGVGPANIGAHGAVYNFVDEEGWAAGFSELGNAADVVVGGATLELLGLGPTDWYVEGDVFGFPTTDTAPPLNDQGKPQPGYALYMSSAVYTGPLVWFIEGKRYRAAERMNSLLTRELYEVAIAPTLEYERAITEDSSTTLNSDDVWGARAGVDWAAVPGELTPSLSVAVYRNLDLNNGQFNPVPETTVHPLLGVEWVDGAWAALANVGFRYDDRDGEESGSDKQLHGDLIAKIPFGETGWLLDLSAGIEWFQWGNNAIQQTDYVEMETAVTVQRGSQLAFIWYTDYTSNPLVTTVGNLGSKWYGAGELQYKPSNAVTLKAFYGAYKAGIRCSGGQCRVLPGFAGGRFSVSAAF